MAREEHVALCARAAASPLFVLPLAGTRPGSFQTLLLQWQPPRRLLVTTLEAFRQQGPAAPSHLVVRLFDDLADKGLVLVRGDVASPHVVSAAQVRRLRVLLRTSKCAAAVWLLCTMSGRVCVGVGVVRVAYVLQLRHAPLWLHMRAHD
jgi:hypothetical protein